MNKKGLLLVLFSFVLSLVMVQPVNSQVVIGANGDAHKITGVVVDAEGEPLPGVTIQNLSTKKLATTDINGSFSIPAVRRDNPLAELYRQKESRSKV